MRRVEGSAGVSLMECTNPVKDKWRIRWDVQEKEDGSASYMEEEFSHKPTDEEIRTLVMSWYNSQTDAAILSGFGRTSTFKRSDTSKTHWLKDGKGKMYSTWICIGLND